MANSTKVLCQLLVYLARTQSASSSIKMNRPPIAHYEKMILMYEFFYWFFFLVKGGTPFLLSCYTLSTKSNVSHK